MSHSYIPARNELSLRGVTRSYMTQIWMSYVTQMKESYHRSSADFSTVHMNEIRHIYERGLSWVCVLSLLRIQCNTFIRVTCDIYDRGMSWACVAWLNHIWHNTFICVTCHTCTGGMNWACVAWLIHISASFICMSVTHSYIWCDSFIYMIGADATHSYMTQRFYTCECLIQMYCEESAELLWWDSFIRVTWLIHICYMTFSYVPVESVELLCCDSFIYHLTLLRTCHDAFHIYRPRIIRACVMWLIHTWRESFVTWLIHTWRESFI